LAQAFVKWCKKEAIEIMYIQPGKPMQNAYIERFNGSFRRDVLVGFPKIVRFKSRENY
jgi:putative transposase